MIEHLLPAWARGLSEDDLAWVERHMALAGGSVYRTITARDIQGMSLEQYTRARHRLLGINSG